MSSHNIYVLPGDGIGAEVMRPAVAVMHAAANAAGSSLNVSEGLVGGVAIDATGSPLPAETLAAAKAADAVLLGGVGGPKWDDLPMELRPEKGLLGLRQALGLFANLRPALLFAPLAQSSPAGQVAPHVPPQSTSVSPWPGETWTTRGAVSSSAGVVESSLLHEASMASMANSIIRVRNRHCFMSHPSGEGVVQGNNGDIFRVVLPNCQPMVASELRGPYTVRVGQHFPGQTEVVWCAAYLDSRS